MKFTLEIGEMEKSLLEVEFSPLQGRTIVRANGHEVINRESRLALLVSETHKFSVGCAEVFNICLEKEPTLFGTPRWRVFVNGRLAKVFQDN